MTPNYKNERQRRDFESLGKAYNDIVAIGKRGGHLGPEVGELFVRGTALTNDLAIPTSVIVLTRVHFNLYNELNTFHCLPGQ